MTAIPPNLEPVIRKVKTAAKGVTETERQLAAACEAMAEELKKRDADVHARYHLAAIVQSANAAIISKDLKGIIQSWNPGAERLLGYKAYEVVNQSVDVLIPEGQEGEQVHILEKLRYGQAIQNYETLRRHKDTRLIPVSLSISPVRNDAGKIIGASMIARDLSGRREMQAQATLIEQLQAALAEVKTLRGFIPICAHCKKIRDDAGYWQGLELYLGRHSTARFSHGICPPCLDKHYGELVSSQLI